MPDDQDSRDPGPAAPRTARRPRPRTVKPAPAQAAAGEKPDEANAGHLTDPAAESYAGRMQEQAGAADPDRERASVIGLAGQRMPEDDHTLGAGIAGVMAAVAEHAPSAVQADGFADIRDAFTRLRDALGLPGTPDGTGTAAEPAGQVSPGPVSAALLEDAMAGARASAAWYRDSPEWQRITLVTGAARAFLDAIRAEAGDYWSEISRDVRVRGFIRTIAARTCRTVSACAGTLAARLEQAGGRQTVAWRAVSLLYGTVGAAANSIIGYRPPVADAEQIIAGLSQQRQAAARPPTVGNPAALAALSFPGPVSQATTAAPAPAHGKAATRTGRRPGGPRH